MNHAECGSGQLCYFGTCVDSLPQASCERLPDALVCDDFEEGTSGYTEVVTEGNAVEAIPFATPSGSMALEARVTAAPSVAYLHVDFPTQTSGTLWMRGWVRAPEGDEGHDLAPLGLWASAETDWSLRMVVKDAALELWYYTTPLTAPVALVPGAWHCLEAAVVVADAPSGRVELSLDGQLVGTASDVDTLPNGGIDALEMGTQWAGAAASIQIDRVLLSSSPTSCWD